MHTRSPQFPAWICVAIFGCAALPLIATNYDHGRAYYDQVTFHYPAIRHFLYGGDFRDYSSATTPGFHLLLAAVARAVSDSERLLKLASLLITSVFIWMVSVRLARRVHSATVTIVLLLPLLFSIYFFPAGVWLLPDNLAWLSVFWVLELALEFRDSWRWYVQAAAALAFAVFVRQSNIWLCLVVCSIAAAPCGEESDAAQVVRRFSAAALASLPCAIILGYFVILWHGMVPPSFAERHSDLNLAAIAYFAAVVGFYGLFYLPLVWNQLRGLARTAAVSRRLWWGSLFGLTAALLSATDWNPDAGRVSGLWNLARLLPSWHHRSVLITGLAVLGGASGALWLSVAPRRLRVVIISAAVGFGLTQCTSHFVYERYYAGLIFLLLLMLIRERRGDPAAMHPLSLAGPLAFAALNVTILGAALL
jgi:hypothetical protein